MAGPIKIPPPPPTGGGKHKPNKQHFYNLFIHKYGLHNQWADIVSAAGGARNVDPLYFAAYLVRRGLTKSSQGQLNRLAQHFGHTLATMGTKTYSSAYREVTTGKFKGYFNLGYFQSKPGPEQTAGATVRGANARDPVFKWKGKPLVIAGETYHISDIAHWSQRIGEYYAAWSPHRPTIANIVHDLQRFGTDGVGGYRWKKMMAARPGFYHSPIWTSKSLDYIAVWQQIYGRGGVKAPRKLVKQAIVNGLSQGAFQLRAQQSPKFKNSQTVKDRMDALRTTYEGIMGAATNPKDLKKENAFLQHAAIQNWSDVRMTSFLRNVDKNPAYRASYEQHALFAAITGSFGYDPQAKEFMDPQAVQQQQAYPFVPVGGIGANAVTLQNGQAPGVTPGAPMAPPFPMPFGGSDLQAGIAQAPTPQAGP